MPDTKISADPAVTSPADTDLIPVVATGANSRFTFASLKAYLLAGLAVFGASGSNAAKGFVPSPGTTAGVARYLREDATWFAPPFAPVNQSVILMSSLGLTLGINVTSAQRTANGTALQTAVGAGPLVVDDLGGAIVEYTCATIVGTRNAGLYITGKGIQGVGNGDQNGTRFCQFATNHPVLTFGNMTTNTQLYGGGSLTGIRLSYGVDQTSQTSAYGLMLGRIAGSFIDQVTVNAYAPNGAFFHAYEGVRVGVDGTTAFYDNIIGRLVIESGQNWLMNIQASGTGNVFHQVHCGSGGVGNRIALAQGGLNVFPGANEFGTITQLNLEWGASYQALYLKNLTAIKIETLHIEGWRLVGANARFIYAEIGAAHFGNVKLLNTWVANVTGGTSGTCKLLGGYSFCKVKIDNLFMIWDNTTEHVQNVPINLVEFDTSALNRPLVDISHITIQGNGAAISPDNTLPAATYGQMTEAEFYRYRPGRSETIGASFTQGDANLTVYAAHRSPSVVQSVKQTADRTLTLTNKSGATGIGSTTATGLGSVVWINRYNQSGGAGQLLVKDEAGTTIDTWAAAAEGTRTYILTGTSVALA